MKNIIAIIVIITSLVIIFSIACVLVGNLMLAFTTIPAFVFLVTQVLKDLTNLNDAPKNDNYAFVYNIAANEYFMVSEDVLYQYKNNASFIIPN